MPHHVMDNIAVLFSLALLSIAVLWQLYSSKITELENNERSLRQEFSEKIEMMGIEVKKLARQIDTDVSRFENQMRNLNEKQRELEQNLDVTDKIAKDLNMEHTRLGTVLDIQNKEMKATIKTHNSKIVEMASDINSDISKFESKVQVMRAQIRDLEKSFSDSEKEHSALRRGFVRLQSLFDSHADEVKNEFQDHATKIKDCNSKAVSIKSDVEKKTQGMKDEHQNILDKLSDTEKDSKELKRILQRLQIHSEGNKEEVKKVLEQIDRDVKNEIDKMAKKLEAQMSLIREGKRPLSGDTYRPSGLFDVLLAGVGYLIDYFFPIPRLRLADCFPADKKSQCIPS